jgi:PAS domain S-box-containing protein
MNPSTQPAGIKPTDFSSLYRGLDEPAWVIDPETSRFLDANGEAVAQLGFSAAEVARMGVTDVNRAVPDEDTWRKLTRDLAPGQSVAYVAELTCRSGDSIDVEITMSCQVVHGQRVFLAITRTAQAG